MMIFDKPRTYNKGLSFQKALKSGNHEIQITITPFQEVTLEMIAKVRGKEVDRYTGREFMERHNFPVRWWIEKHTPRGANWNADLAKWYSGDVIPVIEAETAKRNILHPSQR